jgi:hypothetical protein
MKKYAVLLILLVVLVAGCTGSSRPVKIDSSRGLTINNFVADPVNVDDGEFVTFSLELENIGGTTASNAQVDLFGVENHWRDSAGNLIPDTQTKVLGTLKPPQPSNNVPGDLKFVSYQFKTPDVPEGIREASRVIARVTYDYDTNGILDIPALTVDEIRQRETNNKPIESPTIVDSAGPIKIAVETKNNFLPIRVDLQDASPTQEWPLRVIFKNVGDGFPITQDDFNIVGGGRIKGKLTIFGAGNPQFADCLGESGTNEIDLDSTDIPVNLRRDGTYAVPCMISIDKAAWGERPFDFVKLQFELFYKYYVEDSATINVQGKA